VAAGYRAKVIAIEDAESTTADPDSTSADQNVVISVKNERGGQVQISEENYQLLKDFLLRGKSDE